MTLSQIRAAVRAAIAARHPSLKTEEHGGIFTEKEVALLLGKAPALLVGCLGFPSIAPHGREMWRADIQFAVYVFAADTATTARDVLALDVVQDLMTWIPDQRWGVDGAQTIRRESMAADNLYTGHVNILRIALWAVTWQQAMPFSHPL